MDTPAPRRPRSPLTGAPAPAPVDWAKVGRSSVRRRARGMTHTEAAAALEDARFEARQDSRHEDLANDERGPAELAEWARMCDMRSLTMRGVGQ
ncbi:hypothetical protein OTB20_32935 [Streptomyces sp. H27-H1]|uniref:hypothetical protein n=1 Tax=Streptomyces sp. H27-H1 TaxID=2996461 RepID=UPI002271980C|nr:hypothetical protein [Streptomyces sp. H27-H1]MCY0930916.1 hypothetical protein [Streptomyces sp. H27-H1]